MSKKITKAQLDKLGRLVETANNLVHAGIIPIPDRLRVKALDQALTSLHAELKALYVEIADNDPWVIPVGGCKP